MSPRDWALVVAVILFVVNAFKGVLRFEAPIDLFSLAWAFAVGSLLL